MIKKIQISNIATYRNITTIYPKAVNFIYGGNGTGKTTLARVLAEKSDDASTVEWSSVDHQSVIVFNRDFVEKNFSVDKSLPGIFTLGSESVDLQNEITELKEKQKGEKERREGQAAKQAELKRALQRITDEIKEECWKVNSKYGQSFAKALVGFRSSKDAFFQKCISLYQPIEAEKRAVLELEELLSMYHAAYSKDAEKVDKYVTLTAKDFDDIDNKGLISKVITGKADTPVGTFIQFLNAGDWVKQGVSLAEKANGKCPYCQREIPEDLEKQIEEFFDEEFEKDCAALEEYQNKYEAIITEILTIITGIKEHQYSFIQYDDFLRLAEKIETTASYNAHIIERKIENPSKTMEIRPIKELLVELADTIESFNNSINDNNTIVENQKESRNTCQRSIWNFFLNLIDDSLKKYKKQADGYNKGIKQIEDLIKSHDERIKEIGQKIEEKEAQLTSVLPTVSAINRILKGFGFTGFSLAENKGKPGTYSIVRADGSDASGTLSEGEYNFISFLYFYHLCFGSHSSTGVTQDKIIVIDDPISSLDSNVLFVIATLVKTIIRDCLEKERGIEQVFVLTHNVYFHKEINYLGNGRIFSPKKVAYFIIKKTNEESYIVSYRDNPIKTSYEILWEELRNPTPASAKSAFNAMRRILEHYFQVIGGITYEDCIGKFEGEDKIICNALVAFINDGSHTIFDDLVVSFDEASLDNYLRVFKLIFERLNQIDHYNMMMKISKE